jgi:DNA-binding CsgD family transcriptional regulator/tetratricopeptide (TPR) repeat protein
MRDGSRQIVGRERELEVASSMLDGLLRGPTGLVLEGEAGIGKTALWRAMLTTARERGCHVLYCQGERSEAQLAFAGLSDLLDSSTDAALAALHAPQRQALEVALLRRALPAGSAPDRRMLGVALRSLLCELASTTPLVLAVDDLQWLDASTMRLLAFATRRFENHRVAIFLTERGPPYADPLALERALGADRFVRVRLRGLPASEIGALVELHLGQALPRRLIARVSQASGGNPLYALECARALGSAATFEAGDRLPVPESLRELVRARLAGIPANAREALLVIAALARPTPALVEQASSHDGLAEAEESGLLRVDGERVWFIHPLYAAAVYDAAATSRRRRVHSELAQLLDDPDERVQHRAAAAAGPDQEIALALEQAALRARVRGASAAAAALLERAVALTPPERELDSLRRRMLAAEDHLFAGEHDRSQQLLEEVVAGLPAGPERARARRALALAMYWHDSYSEARRLLEDALEEAGDDDWVRARANLDLAWVFSQTDEFARAGAAVSTALEIAERLDDPQLLGEALSSVAITRRMLGMEYSEEELERALALERWDTRTFSGLRPSINAAWICMWTGRLQRAELHLATFQEELVANGQETTIPLALLLIVLVECAAGQLARAAAISDQLVAAARELDSQIVLGATLAARAIARAHLGLTEAANTDVLEAIPRFDATGGDRAMQGVATACLGFCALSAGDAARAHELLAPLADFALEHGIGEPMLASFLPDEIEALVRLGMLERAGALLDLLELQARRVESGWAFATAGRGRGLLLAAQGDLKAATGALELALSHHEPLGMPIELARTQLVYGQVLRRARQKRAAGEQLRAALATFERCGATLWAQRAQSEIERLGMRTAPKQLTVTEERVATLASRGMTNKEIAAELFISPKTVEANIARAYKKLGVNSRAALGTAMAKSGEAARSLSAIKGS